MINTAGPNSVYHRPGYVNEIAHSGNYSSSYKINVDNEPLHVVRQTAPITHRQNVRIRYLEPPHPPKPAPIIIKERQLTPPPPPPPLVIRQRPMTPPTPPPLVIRFEPIGKECFFLNFLKFFFFCNFYNLRERPPPEPAVAKHPTVIEKIVPPPTPPPRQIIVERIPAPQRPRDLIYEVL